MDQRESTQRLVDKLIKCRSLLARKEGLDPTVRRAIDLLRAGDLHGAEEVLAAACESASPHPRALHLLAKLKAQNGDVEAARHLWLRALETAPGNVLYCDGLRRLRDMERGKNRLAVRIAMLCGAIAFLAILIASIAHWNGRREQSYGHMAGRAQMKKVEVHDMGKTGGQASGTLCDTVFCEFDVDTLDRAISRSARTGRSLGIVFNEGIFSKGIHIDARAQRSLVHLASILKQRETSITIIGHTDDIPVLPGSTYVNNESLALKRAYAIAAFLAELNPSLAEKMSVRGSGATRPPFSNSSPENRRRNRTVVITLSVH